jgi:uncharacterized protein DUF3604
VRALERRQFLKALAVLSGGLAMRPSLGSTLGGLSGTTGASRRSRLGGSLVLVHTDLHNHSLISGDALGAPGQALRDIRAAGIDVACMTEHAVSGMGHGQYDCPDWHKGDCRFIEGINESDWRAMAAIADAAYDPGSFVSFRGFEYSTPTVGHVNVWFGSDFTDPAHEGALATPRAISEMWRVFPQSQPVADQFKNAPDTALISPFYDWLSSPPGSLPFGGGSDAIASFNHPGYFGNFQEFLFHGGAAKQMVLMEAFNPIDSDPDYFWYGADRGLPNPFNACLNAGWRVGFTGVSDEHSGVYGQAGKGRGGLWIDELTRDGVRRALISRRGFATLEPALRLDATANGVPMGSALPTASGPVAIALDIDRGPDWVGKPLWVEVVGPGTNGPRLLDLIPITVPSDAEPPVTFAAQPDGAWMFLRIIDPDRPNHPLARAPFDHGGAFAYASPWFFGGV